MSLGSEEHISQIGRVQLHPNISLLMETTHIAGKWSHLLWAVERREEKWQREADLERWNILLRILGR